MDLVIEDKENVVPSNMLRKIFPCHLQYKS